MLERHGVVTREAVLAEGNEGGFAGVYPVLKALEEQGKVRRGYFVAGLGAAQFALPGAVDRLRERSEREGSEQVAEFVRAEGWEALVVPNPALFVHMDGLVVPLDEKLLVACLDALEDWVIDWLRERGFDFIDVGFAEAKNLGVNLVALGNRKVLSMAGSVQLNQAMRDRGYEVFAPDMSMFTLGGGGVHCLCQALKRDPV